METIQFDSVNKEETLLSEQVANQISSMIIENQLPNGAKLPNEFELAKQLNVGRGTIREAVKLLVSRNILEIKRGKGTFITNQPGVIEDPLGFSFYHDQIDLAIDLLEVRLHLEPWVAALAAEEATENDIEKIKKASKEVEKDILSGQSHAKNDVIFHQSIAECVHNQVIPKLIPIILYSVDLSAQLNKDVLLPETIVSHRMVIDAIANQDPKAAELAMQRHLMEGLEELKKNRSSS